MPPKKDDSLTLIWDFLQELKKTADSGKGNRNQAQLQYKEYRDVYNQMIESKKGSEITDVSWGTNREYWEGRYMILKNILLDKATSLVGRLKDKIKDKAGEKAGDAAVYIQNQIKEKTGQAIGKLKEKTNEVISNAADRWKTKLGPRAGDEIDKLRDRIQPITEKTIDTIVGTEETGVNDEIDTQQVLDTLRDSGVAVAGEIANTGLVIMNNVVSAQMNALRNVGHAVELGGNLARSAITNFMHNNPYSDTAEKEVLALQHEEQITATKFDFEGGDNYWKMVYGRHNEGTIEGVTQDILKMKKEEELLRKKQESFTIHEPHDEKHPPVDLEPEPAVDDDDYGTNDKKHNNRALNLRAQVHNETNFTASDFVY